MSNIYIQEPPTNGKVLLQTTVGDIDVELWSKEAPKACRNFVQLCLEGYFDKTKFHRLVKGFIVQGGDPNGDGTGGESIYGQPFKDEFHTRLRFVRRGLVAMANSGKDDNASQFFFTLAATPELQNKNTIFGKVTGDTLYNMLKLEDGIVDQDDTPLYPHKIITTKVLSNPFTDIEPRILSKIEESEEPKKPKEKPTKKFNLLSFGEEAEEDEAEMTVVNESYKGQSKSSHDLTDDPKLSSVPAIDTDSHFSSEDNGAVAQNIRKKFEKASADKLLAVEESSAKEERMDTDDKRKEIQKQIKELKKELRKKKETDTKEEDTDQVSTKEPEVEENEVLHEYHKNLNLYADKNKKISKKGTSDREKQTMELFAKFRSKLVEAKETYVEDETCSDDEDDVDDNNEAWLVHCMRANDEKVVVAKDANLPSTDRYDLSDPRNPMAERRRNEKRKK